MHGQQSMKLTKNLAKIKRLWEYGGGLVIPLTPLNGKKQA